MTAHVPSLSEDVWHWLCEPAPARPSAVATGRALVEADDWPPALAVADAILAQFPPQPSRRRLVRA